MAGIIVAGWDKYRGGSVYNIPLGGSLHKQPFAIGGISREVSCYNIIYRFRVYLYLWLLRCSLP